MPVLAMAKASPRMPLPMMALLRLNTDIPNDVFPSNCGHRCETGGGWRQQDGRASRRVPLLPLGHLPLPRSSSPRRPAPPPPPRLTSVKCGSLLGLFCRKPSPSTPLRRGPSSLRAQATAGSSAAAPCSAPCPDPRPTGSLLRSPLVARCGAGGRVQPLRVFAVGHQLHHLRLQRRLHGSGTATGSAGSHTDTLRSLRSKQVPLVSPARGPAAQLPTGSQL